MTDSTPGVERKTRIILYAGKGGVGKTTVAAATAVRAAELGYRTLVVSTDIAHSLGDALATPLSFDPILVADRLYAQEIDPLQEVRRTWGQVRDQMAEMLRQEGVSAIQADELALIPGMEDLAALVQIERSTGSGEYDCVVVDAAPTGETIRLLSMPESFQWYASRIQQWRDRIARMAGPFLRGALPNVDLVDAVNGLADRARALRSVLTDPTRSSYRIVVTPQRMVLREALRAETYLNVFEYPIDAVVLNRVLDPPEDGNVYLQAQQSRQQEVIEEIRNAFPTLPLLEAPMDIDEPIGMPALSMLAVALFRGKDPTEIMHVGPTQTIERSDDGYVLKIPMPNVETGKLFLRKQGDSLYVDVGTFRREITLPQVLAGLTPKAARIRSGMLEIPFDE